LLRGVIQQRWRAPGIHFHLELDSLRADPEFEELVDRVGIEASKPRYWSVARHYLDNEEDLSQARIYFERAVALIEEEFGEDAPEVHYHRALYQALLNERSEALQSLERAIELGFDDERIHLDVELDSLRGDPEFEAVAARIAPPALSY